MKLLKTYFTDSRQLHYPHIQQFVTSFLYLIHLDGMDIPSSPLTYLNG